MSIDVKSGDYSLRWNGISADTCRVEDIESFRASEYHAAVTEFSRSPDLEYIALQSVFL